MFVGGGVGCGEELCAGEGKLKGPGVQTDLASGREGGAVVVVVVGGGRRHLVISAKAPFRLVWRSGVMQGRKKAAVQA